MTEGGENAHVHVGDLRGAAHPHEEKVPHMRTVKEVKREEETGAHSKTIELGAGPGKW